MAYVGNSPTQQSFTGGVDQYNGNNSNTAFGLTRTINTVYDVDVYVENVWQRPATGYTVSANTITFTSAPPAGSNNVVVVYRNFAATSVIPQQGSIVASSLSANLIPSVISGSALSGITTLAAGNTTITGTLSATANVNLDSGTLFVDGTNNRVGINNASPSHALTVTGSAITTTLGVANTFGLGTATLSPASDFRMWIGYDGTNKSAITFENSTNANTYYWACRFTQSTAGVVGGISASNTSTEYWTTSGSTGAKLVQGGIAFPATQVPSSDPNTLDDYEEGTFTPSLIASSGTVGSYSARSGSYVRIGSFVMLVIEMTLSNKGTLGSAIRISDLPFSTSLNGFQGTGLAQANWSGLSGTLTGGLYGSAIYLYNQASTNQTNLSGSNLTNTSEFGISISYRIT
jgi:hypothetical protein